jgi:outer membrane usher protein
MHCRQVTAIAIVAWLATMLATPGNALAQTGAEASGTTGTEKLIPLDVVINDTQGGQWVLLQRNGILYAPEEAFVEWRLNWRADADVVNYRGQKWIPLNAVPGFKSKFNYAEQSVELDFSPQAFQATRLAEKGYTRPALTPTTPALFLNYDLSYTGSNYKNAPSDRSLGALTELGLSTGAGVLTSSFVGQNLTGTSQLQPQSWRRLETTFTHDYLDSNTTLKLGDSTTRRGSWGRPVYFGGLQIGSNFGLTPGFITQPIPVLSGTSSAPSTVELYVNDVLRQTSNVPTGPFTINNFPLINSSGEAQIVVKDVLGRETVIDQPFFTSTNLLEQGLTDWSTEIGAVRQNLGIYSGDYGQHFVSGMLRHGISKTLTVESQGEWGQSTRDAGLGFDYALPFQTLGQMAFSASHDQTAGSGRDWVLGLDKSTLRHTFSVRLENATIDYRQVGQQTLPYKSQLSGNYNYTLSDSSSFGVGLARIDTYDSGTLTTYSGNYSTRLYNGSLTFSAARITGSTPGYSLGAMFLIPLDQQTSISSSMTRNSGHNDAYVSASKGLTDESGTGWRVLAGNRTGQNYGEGGFYYQGDEGMLTSDVSASNAQQTLRLGAQGGMVMMDGHAFMTRRVQDSFALVEVPGYADVGIGFQNSTLTHTDKDGIALLTRLLPYQNNSVRINPTELPINAELDSIEQVVVPAARSGVIVKFPVRSGRGALITVKLENGDEAPAGATVQMPGDKEEFYVGRRGEVYITGLQDKDTLHMKLDDTTCTFDISLPPANPDDISRVGPVTCKTDPNQTTPDTHGGTP